MKKSTLFLMGAVLVLSIIVVTILLFRKGEVEKVTAPSSTTSSISSTKESSTEPLSEDQINYTKALSMMEHSDRPITDSRKDDVSKAIKEAIAYANSVDKIKDIVYTVENHLSMSDSASATSFIAIIKRGGFTFDEAELEVFESDSSDVIQFLMVLKKDGEAKSYWVGNYNVYIAGLTFTSVWGYVYHGTYG
ncbi:TPA: hypothetical protein U1045_001535 [Streptococcus suis]|nr:hypothetical protein [Streptococcus suis]